MDTNVTVAHTVYELRELIAPYRSRNELVGFVPTMGALHKGHLDLLSASLQHNKLTVVSIFVNPSQFAPNEDLASYPRTLDSDIEKLKSKLSSDQKVVVFAPSVQEMYPCGVDTSSPDEKGTFIEVLGFSHQLEGSIRPFFFRGVATVVTKLLNIVQADQVYFGQKDMQQCAVVKRLIADLHIPVKLNICDTAREPWGLALSSRNAYLDLETQKEAGIIYKALESARRAFNEGETNVQALTNLVRNELKSPIIEEVQYVKVNDKDSLEPLDTARKNAGISLAAIVRAKNGQTARLIDNIII